MGEEFGEYALGRRDDDAGHRRQRVEHLGNVLDAVLARVCAPRFVDHRVYVSWNMDLGNDLENDNEKLKICLLS